MKIQTLLMTALAGILLMALGIFIIKLLLRKISALKENLRVTLTAHITSQIIALFMIITKTVLVLKDAIQWINIDDENILTYIIQTISMFFGLTFFAYFFNYYLMHLFSFLIFGKRNTKIEIEQANITYFVVRGVIIIMLTIVLLPVFEDALRLLIQKEEIPFYH